MFERRRRPTEPLPLTQMHRHLRSGESIPSFPGLLDQIAAIRADAERTRRAAVIDELDLEETDSFVNTDEDDDSDAGLS